MEYAQERVTTLHDFGGADPPAPTATATAVVVSVADREGDDRLPPWREAPPSPDAVADAAAADLAEVAA